MIEGADSRTSRVYPAQTKLGHVMQAEEAEEENKNTSAQRQTWKNARIVDKSLWFEAKCGVMSLKLNPLVTIVSIVFILAFILWCLLAKERE